MEMQVSGGERLEVLLEELFALREKECILERQIYALIMNRDLSSQAKGEAKLPSEVYENAVAQRLRDRVSEHLKRLGIPCGIVGYNYLKEGIAMLVEEPEKTIQMTKEFYPALAKKFQTTTSRIDRAIRHAIEKGCENVKKSTLKGYFGETIEKRGKPTNSQFISTLVEVVRQENN